MRDESLGITVTIVPLRVLRGANGPLRVLIAAPKRSFIDELLLLLTTIGAGIAFAPLGLLILLTLFSTFSDLARNEVRRHRELDMLADRRYKAVEDYRSQPGYTPSLLSQGYQKSRYDLLHKRRGSGDFGRRGSGDLGRRRSGDLGRRGSGDFGRRGSGEFGRRGSGEHGRRGSGALPLGPGGVKRATIMASATTPVREGPRGTVTFGAMTKVSSSSSMANP